MGKETAVHEKSMFEKWHHASEVNWFSDDLLLKRYAKRYLSEAMYAYVEPILIKTGALAAGPIDERASHTDSEGAPILYRYDKQGKEVNRVWHNEGYCRP